MVMKGGLLMAIRYDSSRFTRDADFSTREKYAKNAEHALLDELDLQLELANDKLPYDILCRRQRAEVRPAHEGAQFPTLTLNIGYARRSHSAEMARLYSGQAPKVVQIDCSYNEGAYDVEVLRIGDGKEIQVYSFLSLMAEKMRSLLQQPSRRRSRRQDVYDLNILISGTSTLSTAEQAGLLDLLVASCRGRGIEPNRNSFADRRIRDMAGEEYGALAAEVAGELPPFDAAYATVRTFYEALPWETLGAAR